MRQGLEVGVLEGLRAAALQVGPQHPLQDGHLRGRPWARAAGGEGLVQVPKTSLEVLEAATTRYILVVS